MKLYPRTHFMRKLIILILGVFILLHTYQYVMYSLNIHKLRSTDSSSVKVVKSHVHRPKSEALRDSEEVDHHSSTRKHINSVNSLRSHKAQAIDEVIQTHEREQSKSDNKISLENRNSGHHFDELDLDPLDLRKHNTRQMSLNAYIQHRNELHDKLYRDKINAEHTPPVNSSEDTYKTILFWNKFFNSADFRFGIGHQPFLYYKCKVHQCKTTTDKSQLSAADLVMFHGPWIPGFPLHSRPAKQLYAYLQQEPHFAISAALMPIYKNQMNLTITYRKDSDIWIPYAKVMYNPENASFHPSLLDPKERPRSVAWMVSHCITPGERERYVEELQKYIDVDVYGRCGDLNCSQESSWKHCYRKYEKTYRFYLSLENNYCKDYVSEKAFRPLMHDIIPIVYGGADYSGHVPPHSVIDIMDYPNPRDLADYLHYLTENKSEYNKYFSWKTSGYELYFSKKDIAVDAFCRLCEILHDPNYEYKDYTDLQAWWTSNNSCDDSVMRKLRQQGNW